MIVTTDRNYWRTKFCLPCGAVARSAHSDGFRAFNHCRPMQTKFPQVFRSFHTAEYRANCTKKVRL